MHFCFVWIMFSYFVFTLYKQRQSQLESISISLLGVHNVFFSIPIHWVSFTFIHYFSKLLFKTHNRFNPSFESVIHQRLTPSFFSYLTNVGKTPNNSGLCSCWSLCSSFHVDHGSCLLRLPLMLNSQTRGEVKLVSGV